MRTIARRLAEGADPLLLATRVEERLRGHLSLHQDDQKLPPLPEGCLDSALHTSHSRSVTAGTVQDFLQRYSIGRDIASYGIASYGIASYG